MAFKKEKNIRISVAVPVDLNAKLEELSSKTRLSKSLIINLMLLNSIKRYESHVAALIKGIQDS